jgi:hypothetical protein
MIPNRFGDAVAVEGAAAAGEVDDVVAAIPKHGDQALRFVGADVAADVEFVESDLAHLRTMSRPMVRG